MVKPACRHLRPSRAFRPQGIVLWAVVVAAALLWSGAFAGLLAAAEAAERPDRLVLGVVPSYYAEKMPETTKPVADMLSQRLGIPVEAFIAPSYMGIVEAMAAGHVDIGFIGALQYVVAHDEFGVEVLLTVVRDGNATYRAQIVTRSDHPAQTLEDLRGLTIGFGDIGSTSGYLYPATMLSMAGIDPETDIRPMFLKGHDNVILAVLAGDVDAGATFEGAHTLLLSNEYPDIAERIRIIALSEDIPYDTISVRPGLPDDLKQAIADALMDMAETEDGLKALQGLFFIDGFVPAKDEDYDPLRRVLERMDVMW